MEESLEKSDAMKAIPLEVVAERMGVPRKSALQAIVKDQAKKQPGERFPAPILITGKEIHRYWFHERSVIRWMERKSLEAQS